MDTYILSDSENIENKDMNIQYEENITTKQLIEKKSSKVKTTRKPRVVKKDDKKLEIATNKVSEVINETYENEKAILIMKQNKKSIISKYTNEDFINLCINARIKSNPQGEIEYKLEDPNFKKYKEDLVSLILYINTNIQNCFLRTIKCSICKTEKNYTEFKELSTSSTGRQKNCLECSSKISVKNIIKIEDLKLDDE